MSTPPVNSCNSSAGLIEKYINSAYDNVKAVADNLDYLDQIYQFLLQYGLITNIAVKAPVQAVTTFPITLSGNQVITWSAHSGDYTLLATTGMRVLVLGQTNPVENGIYDVQNNAWTRSVDFDGPKDVVDGTLVFSSQGDVWQVDGPQYSLVPGTDPIIFKDIDLFAYEAVREAREKAQEAAASAATALASEQAAKTSEDNAASSEAQAGNSAAAAAISETNAKVSENAAKVSENNAKASQIAAQNSASLAESITNNTLTFATTAAGIAGTTNGQYFRVPQGSGATLSFIYYLNSSGTAQVVAEMPGKGAITNNVRSYSSLAVAQADVTAGNILNGAYCYVRNATDGTLADEYVNNSGTLTVTGRVMPSKSYVDTAAEPAQYIQKKDGNSYFHRWKDKLGNIIAGWKNDDAGRVYFLSRLLKFGPNGFFGEGMEISADKISNNQITFKKGLDGKTRILDKRGVVLATVKDGKMYMSEIAINLLNKLTLKSGNNGLSFNASSNGFTVSDKRGVVGFRINNDGLIEGKFANAQEFIYEVPESQVIQQLEAAAAAKQSNRFNTQYNVGRAGKKVKVILVYGQSFSVGAQSNCALSTSAVNKYGNVMLGQSPRGTYYSNPAAGNEIYGPVGGQNVFYPLREVCQNDTGGIVTNSGYGETICTTLGDEFKRLHNEAMGVDNDTNFVVCVGSCGVSGRAISQLQKGASPELYNRVETFLDGVRAACDAEGTDFEVIAIVYMQGENDNSQSYSYYLNQSITMRNNLVASCKAKSGQTYDPIYVVNQIGNMYINGTGVPSAQMALPDNVPNTLMVGTYAGLPNPGAHLSANSYRQMGAIFAKEIYRYYSGNGDYAYRAHKAVHRKDTIFISYTPKTTPIKFRTAYNKWDPVLTDDKGFTVTDSNGTLASTDFVVSIVSDRVIKIKANRNLVGTVKITLGDKSHAGIHNLADSSIELCGLNWEYSGTTPGQYTQENIADYVNKPYSLHTYAAIQQIQSEGI